MKNKRYKQRKSNKFIIAVGEHVHRNAKDYIIITVIFFIGVILGIILVNNSSAENKQSITGYIQGFVDSVKNNEYTIDGNKLLYKSLCSNIKYAFIIWIAGSTIIGIPIVYLMVGYKGLCIGYSISSMIATLGKAKGFTFSIATMLSQNVIAIPCIFILVVSSIKMYRSTMKSKDKESIKAEIFRHTMLSLIMVVGLSISSFFEYLFTISCFRDIVVNFV